MIQVPPSYYLCSADQSRRTDERTISEFGIEGFTLMEIAGTRAADVIQSEIPASSHGIYFCGKGNNAGDALVVARLLSQQSYKATLCFMSGTDDLSPDTLRNLELIRKLNAELEVIVWDDFRDSSYDFIVDGMLGTGLDADAEVRPPYDEAISWINKQDLPVYSMDIPTGLHADSGHILGAAVKADTTLSFGTLKTGFYLNQGPDHTGQIILCELSFPNSYKEPSAFLIEKEWVDAQTPAIHTADHKYDGGVLYVIAGSEGLTGAAIMAAKSAWNTGLGAVVLLSPKGLLEIYEKQLVQIIKKPVGRQDDLYFKESHTDEILNILKQKPGKILIGPGLGRNKETIQLLQKLFREFAADMVIDADGLFALSEMEDPHPSDGSNWILTPHPGELKILVKSDVNDDLERMNKCSKLADDGHFTVLSKGMPSIIGTQTGNNYLTAYDTRIFSRAGFGDVLAGKVAAYWLIHDSPELACMHALLDGYQKSQSQAASKEGPLEPMDII